MQRRSGSLSRETKNVFFRKKQIAYIDRHDGPVDGYYDGLWL